MASDKIRTSMNAGYRYGIGIHRGVAQLVARLVWDQEVEGSSPFTPTIFVEFNMLPLDRM
jgi:hypothetical protein